LLAAEVGQLRKSAGDVLGDLREARVRFGGFLVPVPAVWEFVLPRHHQLLFPQDAVPLGAALLFEEAALVAAFAGAEDVSAATLIS
jgi:hypothetical protein